MECKPTALQKRRENRNTIALDSEHNQIRRRDIVKVVEGPHAVSLKNHSQNCCYIQIVIYR